MQAHVATPGKRLLRRARAIYYAYAVMWTWCALLLAVDLMDLGTEYMVLGFFLAAPIYVLLGVGTMHRIVLVTLGSGSSRCRGQDRLGLVFLVTAMMPFVVHACWPTLYIRFFFWRHERQFQRIVDQQEKRPWVSHYPSGTVFWFHWRTLSDVAFAIVHEPGWRPGDVILRAEVTPLGRSALVHLGGPWYAARY
jgi:hypothetical protein